MSIISDTVHHPALLEMIPPELRRARQLMDIGPGSLRRSGRIEKRYTPKIDPNGLYARIDVYKNFFIRGDERDVASLADRISRLATDKDGVSCLTKLSRLGNAVYLQLIRYEGHEQVVVEVEKYKRRKQFNDDFLPLDWIGITRRLECNDLLDQIEQGRGAIQIDFAHPDKIEIINDFYVMTMRRFGAVFLQKISMQKIPTHIRYEAKKNGFGFEKNIPTVWVDLENIERVFTLGVDRKLRSIDPGSLYLLVHELLHASHTLAVVEGKEEDLKEAHIIKFAQYCSTSGRYKYEGPYQFYLGHEEFEEQRTICGIPNLADDFSENSMRYAFGDPLRYGHGVSREGEEIEITGDSLVRDPCLEIRGQDFTLMILKKDRLHLQAVVGRTTEKLVRNSLRFLAEQGVCKDQKKLLIDGILAAHRAGRLSSEFMFDHFNVLI